MNKLDKTLSKIEVDIAAGKKLKSADRLRNLINQYPNNMKLWEQLGELYYEAGFLDAAGRYWILTEPVNDKIKRSIEVYLNSVNHSGYQILQDITFRGKKELLSPYARQKLIELEQDSKQKVKVVPTFSPINLVQPPVTKRSKEHPSTGPIFLLMFLFALFFIFATGLHTIYTWIFG